MSAKRRTGKKDATDEATLSKEQDTIARYVRFNCPTSTTMFQGNEVHYFSGSKAVDTLMDSCYGTKAKNEASMLFPNRLAAVNYMRALMTHQLFFPCAEISAKEERGEGQKRQRGR
ncbi:hypothetical protein KIN20_026694 [Parelaphostrongylus tenuis]|uniref:Translocation protein SEC62 n=1 Tax=Parelaphostrongylus tenuis TaxID=148309 RepID=A0AAD5QYD2_PARTN|nr:hypothetical protein KIN20_026694 [Parelaphostrongylus tenuis]